jgi:glycosyltransferase involved in cell wall biosynthesis
MEKAAGLGIADKIVITGVRSDVPALLAATDVFVLSSLWEGMPVALLEAMAAGCPAVATDVGGVAEVLKDGVTGLIVPPADSAALADAISACLDRPELARERAAAAQKLVVAEYDKSTMIRRWEAVYRRELKR